MISTTYVLPQSVRSELDRFGGAEGDLLEAFILALVSVDAIQLGAVRGALAAAFDATDNNDDDQEHVHEWHDGPTSPSAILHCYCGASAHEDDLDTPDGFDGYATQYLEHHGPADFPE